MSRSFLPKLMVLVAALAALVFWIIVLVKPDAFGDFKISYVIAALVLVIGIYFMLKAIQQKDTMSKRAFMFLSIPCLVGAVAIVVAAIIGLKDKLALPILLAAVVLGFILSLCVTGGKKWDEGDNHQAGYKNYYQRKAEEEKKNKEE